MRNLDLRSQSHTNALVLDYLLRPDNSVAAMPEVVDVRILDAERLLDAVLNMHPSPEVILNVGAQILKLDHKGVAKV